MSLRILDQGSFGAAAVNDDAYGAVGDFAWVLDGATGLGRNLVSPSSDAAWLAQAINEELARACSAHQDLATQEILRLALGRVEARYHAALAGQAVELFERPTAAGILLRAFPDQLELTSFGDCRAIFQGEDGLDGFGGGLIEALDSASIAALKAVFVAKPQASLKEARAEIWPLLRAQRIEFNTEGGHWALAPDPAVAGRGSTRIVARRPGPILLASDGFTRLWDVFGLLGAGDALAACAAGQGAELYARLRGAEIADPEARTFARIKQHDDATWLCIQVEQGVEERRGRSS